MGSTKHRLIHVWCFKSQCQNWFGLGSDTSSFTFFFQSWLPAPPAWDCQFDMSLHQILAFSNVAPLIVQTGRRQTASKYNSSVYLCLCKMGVVLRPSWPSRFRFWGIVNNIDSSRATTKMAQTLNGRREKFVSSFRRQKQHENLHSGS